MKPMARQEDGVGEGADDLGLEVFLLLGEVGDALEDVFEEAALLPGADHADGQLVEGVGVLGHRFGQAGAVGDAAAHVAQHFAQGRLRRLPFEQFQAAHERHAGVEQVGQLGEEGRHDAALDAPRRPLPSAGCRRRPWPRRC